MRPSDLVAKGWCKKSFALNCKGYQVQPESLEATSWCALGAVWYWKASEGISETLPLRTALWNKIKRKHRLLIGTLLDDQISYWNDHLTTKKEVIQVLKEVENEVLGEPLEV